MHVFVRACMCVRERERENVFVCGKECVYVCLCERETERECVCVCVCVCVHAVQTVITRVQGIRLNNSVKTNLLLPSLQSLPL